MSKEVPPISLEAYLMGRDKEFPLTEQMKADAAVTVERVNQLLAQFGEFRKVTSGYRPPEINQKVPGASEHSNHTLCRACDIYDPKGDLDRWCIKYEEVLRVLGLWIEHHSETPGWCHCQIVPPKSGSRFFFA